MYDSLLQQLDLSLIFHSVKIQIRASMPQMIYLLFLDTVLMAQQPALTLVLAAHVLLVQPCLV
jgi:hypothetical protein